MQLDIRNVFDYAYRMVKYSKNVRRSNIIKKLQEIGLLSNWFDNIMPGVINRAPNNSMEFCE